LGVWREERRGEERGKWVRWGGERGGEEGKRGMVGNRGSSASGISS